MPAAPADDLSFLDRAAPNMPEAQAGPPDAETPSDEDNAKEFARLMAEKAKPNIVINDSGLVLGSFDQLIRYATMAFHSGVYPDSWVPRGATERQGVAAIAQCILFGLEIGLTLSQTWANVLIVRGRPQLWGNALLGKVWASGKLADIDVSYASDGACTIKAKRFGVERVFSATFGPEQAKLAGLGGKDTYKGYARDMYYRRALSRVLSVAFPDVVGGFTDEEGREDIERANESAKIEAALKS